MDEPVGLVTMVAKEGREGDLLALLDEMATLAAADDGCEIYSVHQSRREPRSVFLYERYRDKDAFKLHQANEKLRDLGGRLRELTDSMEIIVGNLIAGDDIRR